LEVFEGGLVVVVVALDGDADDDAEDAEDAEDDEDDDEVL
jgi:hypothetical protein